MTKPHRTVSRVARILEHVSESETGVKHSDLVAALQAPKSSIHGLIQGLLAVGYLTQHNGRLFVGPSLAAVVRDPGIETVIWKLRPELARLSKESGETTIFAVRRGNDVVYVAKEESDNPLRYVAPLGQRRPLFNTASGKIFLANLGRREVEAYIRVIARQESVSAAQLLEDLEEVRKTGVAYNRSETVGGVYAVAAGVADPLGGLVGTVSIVGPTDRMSGLMDAHAKRVLEAVERCRWLLR